MIDLGWINIKIILLQNNWLTQKELRRDKNSNKKQNDYLSEKKDKNSKINNLKHTPKKPNITNNSPEIYNKKSFSESKENVSKILRSCKNNDNSIHHLPLINSHNHPFQKSRDFITT